MKRMKLKELERRIEEMEKRLLEAERRAVVAPMPTPGTPVTPWYPYPPLGPTWIYQPTTTCQPAANPIGAVTHVNNLPPGTQWSWT